MNERVPIELTVNGVKREAWVEPRRSLADMLREDLGLTGTHVGCEQGVCGACTIIVEGDAVRSCLMLAVQADGRRVQTVESLAGPDGELHPIQKAFSRCHGLQCGFCTPGFLMSAMEFLSRNPQPSADEIRESLSGNLCRCGCYPAIVESVEDAARRLNSRIAELQDEGPVPGHAHSAIGLGIPRVEDPAILSGSATYVGDVSPPGAVHVAVLRSPHPHALIKSIDVKQALEMPGVAAIVTGAELRTVVGPVASFCEEPVIQDPLAVEKVRYEGEGVAAVAAESRAEAEDALDRIVVEYELLPTVADPYSAQQEDAPLVHETLDSNIVWKRAMSFGDVEGNYAKADRIIRRRLRWHRMSAQAIETAGVVASWEPGSQSMTVWSNAGLSNMIPVDYAEMLHLDTSRLNLVQCHVGGSFGSKVLLGKHMCIAGGISKLIGRPAKFIDDRFDHIQAGDNTASDRYYDAELAVTDGGEFLSLRLDITEDYGAYFNLGPAHHANSLSQPTGPYRIGSLEYNVTAVLTNKVRQAAFRGAGSEVGNFVLERVVDAAADELGFDRVELRRRNFIQPEEFPYRTPQGNVYDSGNYEEVLSLAVGDEQISHWIAERDRARQEGRYIGIGLVTCQQRSAFAASELWVLYHNPKNPMTSNPETVDVTIDAEGKAFVTLANSLVGTSPSTLAGQVLTEELGIDPGTVAFRYADSQAGMVSAGPGGSRTTVMLTGAIARAANQIKDKMLDIAEHVLEVSRSDLVFDAGNVSVIGSPASSLSFAELARLANHYALSLPHGMESGLRSTVRYDHPYMTEPSKDRSDLGTFYGIVGHGCHVAVVEVDPETGVVIPLSYLAVNDSGTVVSPKLLEGQIMGGVVQGMGAALSEQYVYGAQGELLTRDLGDYLIPSIDFAPQEFRLVHHETPSPFTQYGVKGGGEGGRLMAPAAIASAVEDALRDFDVKVNEAPITPSRIVELVQASKAERLESR